MKKILKFLLKVGFDVGVIAVSFSVSEYVAQAVLKNRSWWVELILYMAVYMTLSGLAWLVKHLWKRRSENAEN